MPSEPMSKQELARQLFEHYEMWGERCSAKCPGPLDMLKTWGEERYAAGRAEALGPNVFERIEQGALDVSEGEAAEDSAAEQPSLVERVQGMRVEHRAAALAQAIDELTARLDENATDIHVLFPEWRDLVFARLEALEARETGALRGPDTTPVPAPGQYHSL